MGFVKEFKEFAMKGNVMDMAVGVIIGGAFGKIVSSLVDDVLMPIIGMITGGVDFTGLVAKVGDATVKYGTFIQNIIEADGKVSGPEVEAFAKWRASLA